MRVPLDFADDAMVEFRFSVRWAKEGWGLIGGRGVDVMGWGRG